MKYRILSPSDFRKLTAGRLPGDPDEKGSDLFEGWVIDNDSDCSEDALSIKHARIQASNIHIDIDRDEFMTTGPDLLPDYLLPDEREAHALVEYVKIGARKTRGPKG